MRKFISVLLLFCCFSAQAATMTFDALPSPGIQDGDGNWNNTGTDKPWRFYNDLQNKKWFSGSDAVFGGGSSGSAGIITVTSSVSATNISFTPAYSGYYKFEGLAVSSNGAISVNSKVVINNTFNGTASYLVGANGILGGNGTIDTTSEIKVSSTGQITAGDFGQIGMLTLSGSGSRVLAGTYLFDVNYTNMQADDLKITQATSVDISGMTFKIGTEVGTSDGYQIKIFESNVATIGTFTTSGLSDSQSVKTFDGGKSYYLVQNPIPEPSSLAVLVLGSVLLLKRPSRKKLDRD